MVKSNAVKKTNEKDDPPNIFRAARNNDPLELALALQDGQTLNDTEDPVMLLTPIHEACISRSTSFLSAAMGVEFDPWQRDGMQRLAIDHARVENLTDFSKYLHQLMYPNEPEPTIISF